MSSSFRSDPENCINLLSPSRDRLNIITQNIRSISANISGFEVLLSRIGVSQDIIVLTECWLSCNPNIPSLEGYNHFCTARIRNQNDGVVVYAKKHIKNITVSEPTINDANCLSLVINNDLCLLAIYRSPSVKDLSCFLNSLDTILKNCSSYRNLFIIGDINVDIGDGNNDAGSADYLNLVASHGLLPAHTLPTHGKTSLDHAIIKTILSATSIVVDSVVTDHNSVVLSLDKIKTPYVLNTKTKTNTVELKKCITEIDFAPIYTLANANDALEYLLNSVTSAINKCSTTFKVPHKQKIVKPWITPGLLRCIRNRDRMHKQLKKSPDNETLQVTYKRYRNFCNGLLRKIKRGYEKDRLNKAGTNSKKLWSFIKDVTHTKKINATAVELTKIQLTPQESVNAVNEFFVNVAKTLADKVVQIPYDDHKNSTQDPSFTSCNSFVLLNTDEQEIECLIKGLRSDCAVGIDGISSNFLKQHSKILTPHLTHIFNQCISTGVFPDSLKRALIHPIYKSGDRDRVNNYRPISVLPSLSKILERIMNGRLTKYLENNNILSDRQYGFRSKKSTNDAVHDLTNHIVKAMDKGSKPLAIFLDLAKAFDTVSIPKLILKLEALGVRGNQLKLFHSYLTNRSQCVKVGEYLSKDLPVEHGVPQGSILGPTLFLVYINEMCNINLERGKLVAFADDTALIFTGNTWEQTFAAAQSGFDIVNRWLADNTLSLNVDKTKLLTCSIRNPGSKHSSNLKLVVHNHATDTQLDCDCPIVAKTDCIRYLGVIIDQRLTFAPQIDVLTGRIRKLIYIFKHLRHVAGPKILKMVYYALCESLLGYCISSWGGAAKTHLIKLERAQRAVLKVCTFKPFRFPTKDLYEYCEVLSVRKIFILQIIMKQHSSLAGDKTLLSAPSFLQQRRKRKNTVACTTICKTSFSQRFYYFLGCFLYNKINNISRIENGNSFECKKIVSNWLMSQTYLETENLLHPVS